jgi:hypothetical protein
MDKLYIAHTAKHTKTGRNPTYTLSANKTYEDGEKSYIYTLSKQNVRRRGEILNIHSQQTKHTKTGRNSTYTLSANKTYEDGEKSYIYTLSKQNLHLNDIYATFLTQYSHKNEEERRLKRQHNTPHRQQSCTETGAPLRYSKTWR